MLAWHFDKLTIVSSSFFVAHVGTISLSKDAYHGMKVAVKRVNLIPPLETCNQTYNCTFHHVSRAKSISSAETRASGIFLMISASSCANNISTNSSIHCLVVGSISKSKVEFPKGSMGVENASLAPMMLPNFYFFTIAYRQRAPRCRTSLPLKMLFHAHEPILESTASIIEVLRENLALRTL